MALLVGALVLSGSARATPLELTVQELVGANCERGWAPIHVSVRGVPSGAREGRVTLSQAYLGAPEIVAELDLSDCGNDPVETILYAPPGWCGYEACVEVDGRGDCESVQQNGRGSPVADVLVLQDRLELRPALATATIFTGGVASHENQRPVQATVARRRDGDGPFILPERAVGYSSLRAVVAEVSVLDGLTAAQREALASWVRGGGRLVTVGGRGSDLVASPFISQQLAGPDGPSLTGEPEFFYGGSETYVYLASYPSSMREAMPQEQVPFDEQGLDRLAARPCGAMGAVGLGSLFLLPIEHRRGTLSLEHELASCLSNEAPYKRAGWSASSLDSSTVRGGDRLPYGLESLDPNRTDRPPTWAYLLVVTFFVVGLVLVQRRWARQREGMVSRLVLGVSAVSIVATLLFFGVAQGARGFGARYRASTSIDVAEGWSEGPLLRHLALHFDAPGRQVLPIEEGNVAFARGGELRMGADGAELELSGRRWETVTAVENGVAHLNGVVVAKRDGGRSIVAVVNSLDQTIHNARFVYGPTFTPLGDLAPGATVSIASASSYHASELPDFLPDIEDGAPVLVGEIDTGCPRRGELRGDGCTTHLLVRMRP